MLRAVALLLAAAATACGKDADGGQCQGLAQCALDAAHHTLHALNTGFANDAEETSSRAFGETAGTIVGDAIRDRMTDGPSTPATQSTITCKYEKKDHQNKAMVRPCKEGDIVVDTANGVLCTFIKYKTKWPWVECRNPHDQVLSYRAATLRHATDGEKSVHKKAVDAYNVYTENGGEKPVLPKVARFANEGSGPDPAAMKKNTEVMRGLLKNGGWTGGTSGGSAGSAALDGDDVQVLLAFDTALSSDVCIKGRARKYKQDDLRGSSPAKKSALFEAQNGLLKEWEEVDDESDCKKKDGLMSGKERQRRAQAKAKEDLDQQESKKTTQINLDGHGLDENGNYVARETGRHVDTGAPSYKRVTPNVFLDSTAPEDVYLTETLVECAGGEDGVLEKAPKLLYFYFSYDQLQARADLQYFDSNKGTGQGDHQVLLHEVHAGFGMRGFHVLPRRV